MKASTLLSLFLLSALCLSCVSINRYKPNTATIASPKGTNTYQADSASIAQHYKIPDWFRNAKFGIFVHWGLASIPAYDGWYGRFMYDKNSKTHEFHEKKYGPVDKFGYKDFIPMFKPDKFDPAAWAKLFKEAGAQYVIPVAEHHDGFALYHSTFNPWNSVDMGPKRDFMKELRGAILAEKMHFGLSSHRAENCWFFNTGMNIPSDVQDTTITMYGERIAEDDGGFSPKYNKHMGSNEHSRQNWLTHMHELIDQYQPELLYFDWTVGKYPFQPVFYKFLAYYYNNSIDWKKEVVVNTKFGYGDNIQVLDIERGKSNTIRKYPWQTDTSIGKEFWFFMEHENDLKNPNQLVDDLVDIVSKNGNLLLNVGPRADGSIPEKQQRVLKEIGHWLQINGEAIYGTRPWIKYGEGPHDAPSGYMSDNQETPFTEKDIRFTTKGDVLYAIAMDWPKEKFVITSLAKDNQNKKEIRSVSLLGCDEKLEWKQTNNGLEVNLPSNKPSNYAHVLKID